MEVKIKNLKKSFDKKIIWDKLFCNLRSGEIVSILGRSGERKTTFLRVINGLEDFDSGQILIDDKIYNPQNQEKRQIGMVFQSYNLFANMNVWQNLTLGPKYHKMKKILWKKKQISY
ncbi:MAG: ATP-binding cassette domain-containing protein [Peptoniphilaceae bacterium]|nr:ATP-binding cassette domain-containing protein [Peptoniphilaceae bacterium]